MTSKETPGPKKAEILRFLVQVRRNYLHAFEALYHRHGDTVRVDVPGRTVFYLFHPDGAKYLLKDHAKNYKKSVNYKEMEPLLGNGLLTSEGEEWRKQRRLIGPEFHMKALERYSNAITTHSERMAQRWLSMGRKARDLDLAPEMMRLTFEIAGETFFGVDVGPKAERVSKALIFASHKAVKRMMDIWKLPQEWPMPSHILARKAIQSIDDVVYEIIEKGRKNPQSDTPDVLTRLMAARHEDTGTGLSDKELRDQIMTLLLAGHETTSNALSFVWYLLSQNPRAEKNLQDELRSVLGGRTPRFEDLDKLDYARMVFEESMRLYPPAPVISRNAIEADHVQGADIPAGAMVQCSPWITHRHPEFWDRPNEFIPERFEEAKIKQQHPYAYFPFGGGPRECIGKNFALMEGVLILATLSQRFKMESVPKNRKLDIQPLITLKPKNGVRMKLSERRP